MVLNLLIKDPIFFHKNTTLPEHIFGQFGDNIIRLGIEYMGVLCLLYIRERPKNEKELNGSTPGPFLQELIAAKPYQRNR